MSSSKCDVFVGGQYKEARVVAYDPLLHGDGSGRHPGPGEMWSMNGARHINLKVTPDHEGRKVLLRRPSIDSVPVVLEAWHPEICIVRHENGEASAEATVDLESCCA